MYELKDLKIGCIPYVYGDHRIFARSVIKGCNGCFFNKDAEGAGRCKMKYSCMAHFRADRRSVIFIVK